MSQIAYANPTAAPPDLSVVPSAPPDSPTRSGPGWVAVPGLISLTVQLVFFLAYWIPETSTFPGRTWWLAQLAPLAATGPGLLLLVFACRAARGEGAGSAGQQGRREPQCQRLSPWRCKQRDQ